MKRAWLAVLLVGLSVSVLALSTAFAEMTVKNTFQLETGKIEVEYSSEENVLIVRYLGNKEDEQYHLQFTTMAEKMGLLIKVNGSRIKYSVEFLEGYGQLQLDDSEEESYQKRMNINIPGWSIIIVEKTEHSG
ncbi:MAG: hypothetical protein U9N62_10385 [Thermotogota bacterium]|nr:hypothetical protein [Thermotogota bacterium]